MSFPITCTACHKTFTVSDEIYEKKVAGRVVTIKCKACGQGIRLDGTTRGSGVTAPAGSPASALDPPPPSRPTEGLWAVDYPDGQDREFTTAEVIAELERGAVEGVTLVWRDGMAEWLELRQVPELSSELERIAAKKRAETAKAVGPVHKPRARMMTVTGLAGLPASPAAPPQQARAGAAPLPALPKPPLAPSSQEQATAAATPLPKPPAPSPRAPREPIAAPLAAAPPPAPVMPATDWAAAAEEVTPPLPASVAKAFSPAPQLPSPRPTTSAPPPVAGAAIGGTPVVAIADHATVEWPEAKKRSPLVFVALVGVAAAIGIGIFVLGGKNEAPATPSISALPPAAPPTAANTHGAAPAAALEAPPTPTGEAIAPGDAPSQPADPGATPGAGFAELFAAGARKADSKGPADRFDPAATKAALTASAVQALACKENGGPTGKVTVVVTFEPSGKVSSATIEDGPFAGTPTGACIASAFKRATIAPFSGLPGTVSKPLSIR